MRKSIAPPPSSSLNLIDGETKEAMSDQMRAELSLRPSVQAALTLREYNANFGDLPVDKLIKDLRSQCELACSGDLSRAEGMLIIQAHTLDAIFNSLAQRAAVNMMAQHVGATESYLRLALKAQTQCRATLETLAAIKNPPHLAFVKQANIAQGPQQINNGGSPEPPRAENNRCAPNELLGVTHGSGERLDLREKKAPGAPHPRVEALEAVQRTQDGGG